MIPTPLVQLSETKIATFVFVKMASKEMVLFMEMPCHVRTLMSAKAICTIAVFMHTAITLLVLMAAVVSQDSMEMACHVQISMSARLIWTIAVFMHTAIIL